ncbi:MAG: PKD domain-containing protein, partial [Bacteroidales bacterium]
FSATPLSIPVGGTVNFTDLSTGNPTSWEWTFTGGTPSTSTLQNPTGIQYNAVGLYPVKLKATNSISSDSLTKPNYIEVYDPNAVHADFSGTPTSILVGGTVHFTDLSTNSPTTWSWSFPGGTPSTSNLQNPTVTYNTVGVFNVTLTASNGTTSDTEVKNNYITVLDSSDAPHANFIADYTNIPSGNSINFTNLSTGFYDSLVWIFEGATPNTSTDQNPTGVTYNSIGCYDVTLILYSFLGNDTLIKHDYICVFDPSYIDTVHANFHAITTRLIVQGGNVSFEDLSTGPITSWNWYFEGGTPSTSNLQNPVNITYSTPGIYDVRLIVSNGGFSDTLVKQDYIVVTTEIWPDPNGFCDTTSNIKQGEHPLVFIHLAPNKWGYIPGHNQSTIKYYADKQVNYTYSNISGLLVPVAKAYGAAPNNKVRFTVWDVDSLTGKPGTVLGYKDEIINNFTPLLYKSVHFNPPINVNGKFFVGYQLWYNSPVDTFVVYMAPNRGVNGLNTLYMAKTPTDWKTPTQFFNDTLVYNTSLAIQVIGCLVGMDELDVEQHMILYPNPTKELLNIEIVDYEVRSASFEVYDLTGRLLPVNAKNSSNNQFQIDVSSLKQGIYILRSKINGLTINQRFTKL